MTVLLSENEALKRQVILKERLIEEQEKANLEYIQELRQIYKKKMEDLKIKISRHMMQYEDLWMTASHSYERILELEKIRDNLTF